MLGKPSAPYSRASATESAACSGLPREPQTCLGKQLLRSVNASARPPCQSLLQAEPACSDQAYVDPYMKGVKVLYVQAFPPVTPQRVVWGQSPEGYTYTQRPIPVPALCSPVADRVFHASARSGPPPFELRPRRGTLTRHGIVSRCCYSVVGAARRLYVAAGFRPAEKKAMCFSRFPAPPGAHPSCAWPRRSPPAWEAPRYPASELLRGKG